MILNLPDLIRLSPINFTVDNQTARDLTLSFNSRLATEFPEATVFDSFGLFDSIAGNFRDENGNLGISVDESAGTCLGDPICAAAAPDGDSSDYILFDNIHPTSSVHALWGEAVTAAVVPLPSAVWLFLGAFAVLLRGSATIRKC